MVMVKTPTPESKIMYTVGLGTLVLTLIVGITEIVVHYPRTVWVWFAVVVAASNVLAFMLGWCLSFRRWKATRR